MNNPVMIVGAGLSGLCCARTLSQAGVPVKVLEAQDSVGGRVRTDVVDGFRLDRGFQVLLTAYPEAKSVLDYDALNLKAYQPGAKIRTAAGFQTVSDPWRMPSKAIATALAKVGSLADKFRIGKLRSASRRGRLESVFERPEQTTLQELRSFGFSEEMIDTFFRPFLGGVFLDTDLETSSRMLYFVFRMFSEGDTAVPEKGMQEIPSQLGSALPADTIAFHQSVTNVTSTSVTTSDGRHHAAAAVVIATEQSDASQLISSLATTKKTRGTRCVYFTADQPPDSEPVLILNGTRQGIVNNFCVPTVVSPMYSSDHRHLMSATVIDQKLSDEELPQAVSFELKKWFGDEVENWQHLKTYNIPNSLPNSTPPHFQPPVLSHRLEDGTYVCGDYRVNGSIQGAMVSGRLAAEEILRAL